MDSINAGFLCGAQNVVYGQIAFSAEGRTDIDRFIRVFNVQRLCVGIRKNSHRFNIHFPAGADDSDRNFSPVGD